MSRSSSIVTPFTKYSFKLQAPDGPLAELRAPMAAHTETDGEDGVEILEAGRVFLPGGGGCG